MTTPSILDQYIIGNAVTGRCIVRKLFPVGDYNVCTHWHQPGGATYSGLNVYVATIEKDGIIVDVDHVTSPVAYPSRSEMGRKDNLLQKMMNKASAMP